MYLEIERAEATVFGAGNQEWETFLVVNSYKEASEQLAKLINDNDAIGDFFRVVETGTSKIEYGDCKECKHNVDCPHKPKSLAQFIDEYIDYEIGDSVVIGQVWVKLLKQALDAYESTENVTIKIERNV